MIRIMNGTSSVIMVVGLKSVRRIGGMTRFKDVATSSLATLVMNA
jgi:hypothetical protein